MLKRIYDGGTVAYSSDQTDGQHEIYSKSYRGGSGAATHLTKRDELKKSYQLADQQSHSTPFDRCGLAKMLLLSRYTSTTRPTWTFVMLLEDVPLLEPTLWACIFKPVLASGVWNCEGIIGAG